MTTTDLDDFCCKLLRDVDEESFVDVLDPETLARQFVHFFGLSSLPTMDEMTEVMRDAGIGAVSGVPLPNGMQGFHCNSPNGGYDIFYMEEQGQSAREHTVLHETYEIINETVCHMWFGSKPAHPACRRADRFAAAVLMQPERFAASAEASGFDVIALQREYGRSYASVALRLPEVMRTQPLLSVLYQREERNGPLFRTTASVAYFRASVVARTPGFGPRRSKALCGTRGGTLRWGSPIPPGSLAERVALTGRATYGEAEPGSGEAAIVGRPVFRSGRLVKISIVAVPYRDKSIFASQFENPSLLSLPAMADAAGPW